MTAMQVSNALVPEPAQMQSFFGGDTAPMVMLNLLKFRDKAAYPDGSDAEMSGREAYMRYGAAVLGCVAAVGGRGLFSADVTGLLIGQVGELWDMVAMIYYPSPQAMLAMVALPEYQGIEVHRFAGLAGQLNIRTAASGLAAL